MENKKTKGFLHLERNLESMIHEGIVKIGYRCGESLSIYYDYDLLVYLLDIDEAQDTRINIMSHLKEFLTFIQSNWGNVTIELEKYRYKFNLPAESVAYVYKKNKDNTFLSDLICSLNQKDCSIENIIEVFKKYSNDVIYEESTNPEFDYVIYFKDTNIDEFKYCFTFGEMGKYYHRLTEYDYNKLMQE